MTATSVETKLNGHAPGFDAVALAKAEAIRTEASAKAEALRIEAESKAEAEKILAAEKAEKERIANERAAMRLEKDKVDHGAYVAKKAAETAKFNAEEKRANKAAAEEAEREAQQLAEEERSEWLWKWGARGFYAVCLVISGPVQFIDFWDPARKFLVAAPAVLEGLAVVLACGAAWAVAHRRDVLPYRIGIMLGAAIAATINMRGGMTNPAIGFNAGLVGAIASMVGPIVLMAYEHGIAQKADGIPSWRERRAAEKAEAEAAAAKERARAEKEAAEEKAAAEKAAAQARAEEEQARRDADRKEHHPDVWEVAEALRSARAAASMTEQIWGEAWLLVTGCPKVGIRAEIEAQSRVAQAHMRTVTEAPVLGSLSLIESQIKGRQKKDADAPDGRRKNGGTPPVRRPGDTQPYSEVARRQIGRETAGRKTGEVAE